MRYHICYKKLVKLCSPEDSISIIQHIISFRARKTLFTKLTYDKYDTGQSTTFTHFKNSNEFTKRYTVAQSYSGGRFSRSVIRPLACVQGFLQLLRGKTTWKGRPAGREGNRGVLLFEPDVNAAISLAKDRIQWKKNRPSKRC